MENKKTRMIKLKTRVKPVQVNLILKDLMKFLRITSNCIVIL